MRYLSVCSGIEAATVAWHPLGWRPLAFSEIEPFPSAVLAHHYPDVPNLGDMTAYARWPALAPDLIVGGTPCQSFSVAGLRAGLADPRGNLALVFLGVVDRYRPRWVVWENVPGVRSADDGEALGAFLGGLAELGYGWAYRSLDAQYFGLAQRRERVFVVAHLGDWRPPAAVLFEPESVSGHPAPCREAGERIAPTVEGRASGGGGLGTDFDCDGGLTFCPAISPAMKQRDHKGPSSDGDGDGLPLIVHALRGEGADASEDGTGRGTPLVAYDLRNVTSAANRSNPQPGDPCHTLHKPSDSVVAMAYDDRSQAANSETYHTLRCAGMGSRASDAVMSSTATAVRRLTPGECERLQGFPDDHTLVPYRGRPAKDGPRYKALGNSMAVPVMRWIGERVQLVEAILASGEPR